MLGAREVDCVEIILGVGGGQRSIDSPIAGGFGFAAKGAGCRFKVPAKLLFA